MVTERVLQKPLFEIPPRSLADVHTSKRGERERTGVYAWHSYYAGYAEQFVADVLSVLARPGDLIVDPWNGSGTTTLVAQCRGFRSLGIEINPVMVLHAQAKNLQFPCSADDVLAEAHNLVTTARRFVNARPVEFGDIADWVHEEPLAALVALSDAINEGIMDGPAPDFVSTILRQEARSASYPPKEKAFFFSALFQVLRKVGKFNRGSNPTWLLLDDQSASTTTDAVFTFFLETVQSMLADLEAVAWCAEETADYWVIMGDSRALRLVDASVNLIVTSPPYCTRIDYAFSTKPELLLLGKEDREVDALRRATMGAPVIVDKSISRRETWGQTCNDFLNAVAGHPSKASKSYYLPTYLQYFRDAEQSLREIKRVLKDGGQAVIVVQSSYYKDIELPLGDVYVQMSGWLGFDAGIARREAVRQHMAHVNTRSRQYVKDKVYYEDVVLLRK
jgi:SAM-dependent methyltransferase